MFGLVDRATVGCGSHQKKFTKRGVLSDLLRYGVRGNMDATLVMAGLMGMQRGICEKCCVRAVSALSCAVCCAKVTESAGKE